MNAGPISQVDLKFPVDIDSVANNSKQSDSNASSGMPKPIILVGENGSGKSICLSYIVNTLMSCQQIAYPETPEVKTGKVYKLRAPGYIKTRETFSYGKIIFEDGVYSEEITLNKQKKDFQSPPASFLEKSSIWRNMDENENTHISEFTLENGSIMENSNYKNWCKMIFEKNCILYFTPDRFEEPAWLNEENLIPKVQDLNIKKLAGHTNRSIITSSPMHDNQNWLFGVVLDQMLHERIQVTVSLDGQNQSSNLIPATVGHRGAASRLYTVVNSIAGICLARKQNPRIAISNRYGRTLMLEANSEIIIGNIFQLSTGETSLLNIFFSILRDFDLSGANFTSISDICGVVVIDEVDLHLHAVHQYEILPKLIKMFPKVQFIMTSHSPLFILGMRQLFGDDGFVLYHLPEGKQINPEEFDEFENSYRVFKQTRTFARDIQAEVQKNDKPMLFVEGITDIKYLEKASELLKKNHILDKLSIKDGGGKSQLNKIWNFLKLDRLINNKVILLYDCDVDGEDSQVGNVHKIHVPARSNAPIPWGIENRFDKRTLRKAYNEGIINILNKKTKKDGKEISQESFDVGKDQKTALCDWLCQNGTKSDFKNFSEIFDLLKKSMN